jgi:hypothetical protein
MFRRLRKPHLVLPEAFEPIRRKSRVALRAHNRAVAEISLDSSGILAVIRQLVATAMAQHVRVNQEGKFGRIASPGHHPLIACHAKRGAALADKDVQRLYSRLSLQAPSIRRVALLASRVPVLVTSPIMVRFAPSAPIVPAFVTAAPVMVFGAKLC